MRVWREIMKFMNQASWKDRGRGVKLLCSGTSSLWGGAVECRSSSWVIDKRFHRSSLHIYNRLQFALTAAKSTRFKSGTWEAATIWPMHSTPRTAGGQAPKQPAWRMITWHASWRGGWPGCCCYCRATASLVGRSMVHGWRLHQGVVHALVSVYISPRRLSALRVAAWSWALADSMAVSLSQWPSWLK